MIENSRSAVRGRVIVFLSYSIFEIDFNLVLLDVYLGYIALNFVCSSPFDCYTIALSNVSKEDRINSK